MTDVLAARYGDGEFAVSENFYKGKEPVASINSKECPNIMPTSFVLHYAARGPKNKWTIHSVTMSHKDPRQIVSWVKTIRNYLTGIL